MTIAETKLSTFLTHTFIVLTFCIGSNTFANQKIDSSQYLEYFQQGYYHSALAGFQSLSDQNPLATELKFYYGRSLFRDGQLEAAQAVLEDFVSLEPDHSNGFLVLGSVRINRVNEVSIFKKVGLAKAGIGAWHTAADLDQSNVQLVLLLLKTYLLEMNHQEQCFRITFVPLCYCSNLLLHL